ncbi:MAG: hypothetical protein LJE84_04260 [Gammaproteobacteria bacterium]|nr:hypothetical protein [Gammaproteobacteria bacterium]
MNCTHCIRTLISLWLALVLAACAGTSARSPLGDDIKRGLGRIALIVDAEEPELQIGQPDGQVAGGLKGAAAGAVGGPVMAVSVAGSLGTAAILTVPVLGVAALVGMLAGAGQGVDKGLPAMDLAAVRTATSAVQRQRDGMAVTDQLQEALLTTKADGMLGYFQAAADDPATAGASTLLHVRITRLALVTSPAGQGRGPRVLQMEVDTRLVRAGEEAVIDQRAFSYSGDTTHWLEEWSAGDGARLRAAFEDACRKLAEKIISDLLPAVSETSSTQRSKASGLALQGDTSPLRLGTFRVISTMEDWL